MTDYRALKGITVYKTMPKGWREDKGATTAPAGTKWVTNGKSRFAKNDKDKRKSALLITDSKVFNERMKNMQQRNDKRCQQALKLRNELDKVSKEHAKYVNSQVKKQTDSDAVFMRKDTAFSKKEDEAYRKYYEHMHKDFKGSDIEKAILSKKYKEMFMDKNLIKDLYNNTQKEKCHGKKTVTGKRTGTAKTKTKTKKN